MKTLIAFDLDDTLFKEITYVRSGYRAVAKAVADATGADASTLYDIMMRSRPRGFEAVIEYIKGMPGSERHALAAMVDIYNTHTPDISLWGDAEEALAALKSRGCILVLITDGTTLRQRAKIKALGLERFFDPEAILVSEETGGDKTSAIPWEIAEKRFGANRFVYVGDNIAKDFLVPNRRGWHTVMLRDRTAENVHQQHIAGTPLEARPKLIIDSLTALS